jgi:phosphoribosylformimino-5-aminoimidazole carboxamide ribotide isomerase
MIAAPAVDLRGGRCVQLVGGRPEEQRVSLPDPVAVARHWYATGFNTLHIVDLDAALGDGSNLDLVKELVSATEATTQVGGGIRSEERVDAVLATGVDRVIIGTRALEDPDWFAELSHRHPGRIMLALDTQDGRILSKGWTEETGLLISDYLPGLGELPLAGILTTDVGREGRLEGIDRAACEAVLKLCPHPVWISGGVTTEQELAFLDDRGAAGAVLGMALYTDALDHKTVASQWGGANQRTDA